MVPTIYDYARLVVYVGGVLLLANQKTKTFLMIDAIFSFGPSFFLLLSPSVFQQEVTIQFDSLHLYLLQIAGCITLFYSLYYFFFVIPAKDDDTRRGLLACRTLCHGLIAVVVALNKWRYPLLFHAKFYPMLILMSLTFAGLSAYHLYRNGLSLPRRGRIYPINLYIKIDIVVVLLFSIPDLLFASSTQYFLSMKIDRLHEHIETVVAVVHLSTGIFGIYALGFRNIMERKGYLCCRVTVLLLIVACFGYTAMVRKLAMTKMDVALFLMVFIPLISAVTGLIRTSDRSSFTSSESGGYYLRTRN